MFDLTVISGVDRIDNGMGASFIVAGRGLPLLPQFAEKHVLQEETSLAVLVWLPYRYVAPVAEKWADRSDAVHQAIMELSRTRTAKRSGRANAMQLIKAESDVKSALCEAMLAEAHDSWHEVFTRLHDEGTARAEAAKRRCLWWCGTGLALWVFAGVLGALGLWSWILAFPAGTACLMWGWMWLMDAVHHVDVSRFPERERAAQKRRIEIMREVLFAYDRWNNDVIREG